MTNQKTNSQLLQDERPAFEAAYAAEFSGARGIEYTAEDIALLREGDGYGERPYLNGHWKGWQARAALARVAELEKQEPVAVVKGDGSLGAGFPPGTKLYAAPVAQAGQVPEGVRTWFEAKLAHRSAVDAYNARLKFVRAHCPFGTSIDPEYQLMEEADRKARSLIGPMFAELSKLLDAPTQGGE